MMPSRKTRVYPRLLGCLLVLGLFPLGAGAARQDAASTSASLEQVLELTTSLDFGSTYSRVKERVGQLGPLESAPGIEDEQRALWKLSLLNTLVEGRFNFHKGKLISYYFLTEGLGRERALEVYAKVRGGYAKKYGKPSEAEGVSDDARQAPEKTALWRHGQTEFRAAWMRTNGDYRVSWGAQPEAKVLRQMQ